ncbi:hypothetical protein [Trichloromonas acetexigens]|jgi:hypothetical protein|uniref:DUF5666 domain-containing protein n=1 Tax=Trichloromonas acetexigens TaxID=38815 RepID=A0A550JB07_9BACT|nr:hypothetical protein [Desulfuromonas acetexigens]MDY0268505.1 hypothetical protein [Trichloromonas sp.]TRO80313.1 hypothetical protein FL622_11835 [Desulfuromonas acetexigens]
MHKIQKNIFILFLGAFLLIVARGNLLMAAETASQQPYRLDAGVMYIVPDDNLAIIAEKEIHLKSHIEKGIKVWDTRFIDAQDKEINLSTFKKRDRVLVTGSIENGKITADEIRLLRPAAD